MFELRQGSQPLHSFVADIQPGQRSQASTECFQLLHSLVILERFVGEWSLDVATRTPHACRNVQLEKVLQLPDLLELLGFNHAAVLINAYDPNIPIRQINTFANRLLYTT